VIQVASILSSEQEVMQAVQEANEELRDAYETKVKDLFEKQGIDRKSLTTKAIESEVNRCMKLGLNKICLDERLVPILGSQEIGKQESTKIEKSGSWSELKDQL
jgi:predicted GNAT family acetyltransferase